MHNICKVRGSNHDHQIKKQKPFEGSPKKNRSKVFQLKFHF